MSTIQCSFSAGLAGSTLHWEFKQQLASPRLSVSSLDLFNMSQVIVTGFDTVPGRVSNPVFTETEKPSNPEFFQNRKTGFWLPVNPVFRF